VRSLAAVFLLAAALAPAAAGTLTRVEAPAELAAGRADGMAISSRGRLFLSPRISIVGRTDAAHVWSLTADAQGRLYLGTGPDGRVLQLATSGEVSRFHTIEQPMVTALAVTADGRLLAGSAPDGVIYRIDDGGRAEVWAETGERYVWALAVGASGRVFAGTGERGRIIEILPSGKTDVLFDSAEPHIVSLAPLPDGDLLAGGAGRGLVYRVDREGHALVLHDDELPEAVAIAAAPDGGVVAAFVAPPEAERRRPAVRLRLPDGVRVGAAGESVGRLEESSGPTVRGVIEGLPLEAAATPARLRGRVVRIGPDGEVSETWRSTSEAPFCVAHDGQGRLLFGTGEPARLYRVEPGDEVALLATLEEAQATELMRADGTLYLATSNPASIYRVDERVGESGSFLSRPFDAGAPARWGTIRWNADEDSGNTEFYTRTGNSWDPDATWSAWSPALTEGAGSAIVNPDGRFLQWRVRHRSGGGGGETHLSGVTVDYEPHNRPPRLHGFRLDDEPPSDGSFRFVWSSSDPDGDPVDVAISFRPHDGGEWTEAGGSVTIGDEGNFVWQVDELAEGAYRVRAVATDQPGNPPGEARIASERPEMHVVVDRTPPRIEVAEAADGTLEVRLSDRHSVIRRLELIRDGRVRFTFRPLDGVADSQDERFRVRLPADPAAGWTLRGIDAAGNEIERSVGVE